MSDIFENFNISLGIKKNNKYITIKNTHKVQDLEKVEEKSKNDNLEEILKKVQENTEKIKKENEKLEKELMKINKKIENEKKLFIKKNKIKEKENKIKEKDKEKKDKIIEKSCKNNKKNLLNELKKYFKIKNFDILNEIKNIDFELEKSNYDTFELAYSDNYKYNEYCSLLKYENKNTNLLLDYFMSGFFNLEKINKIKIDGYKNCYRNIKIIIKYLDYDIVLLNPNLDIIDELKFKKRKKYFLLENNKIYALDISIGYYLRFRKYILKSINNCLFRDKEKNSTFVLLQDINNYKNCYIHFPKLKYAIFRYQYLLNDLYLKKIGDLTLEQFDILNYLISNFGLHFYLINDIKIINKKDITLDFLKNHSNYCIDNISLFDYNNKSKNINNLIETEFYNCYKDFDYYFVYKNIIVKGITKNEIYNKCYNKYNIKIDLNEIKKNYSYMDLMDVKSEEEIKYLLELFPNNDNILIFNKTNKKILATKLMNFENPLTYNYILDLSNKIKECKICGCTLSKNTRDKSFISIDAINPLLGHTIENNNLDLLCGKCNIIKGTMFMGKYSEKPYFYDIKTLKNEKLHELLKYHKLNTSGITHVLRKRLENYIKNIDIY